MDRGYVFASITIFLSPFNAVNAAYAPHIYSHTITYYSSIISGSGR
jgi:hypothetical protein